MGSFFGDAGKRWAILCLAAAVSATLIYQAGKLSLAWYWGSSGQSAEEMRAVRLVPGDAQAWKQLGEAVEFNFADPDLKSAITYYLRAVKENPRSASNWIALAIAYEAMGDLNRAKDAYKHALRDYPISAEVAWQYGNFLLRQGQTAQALSEIHRALLTDPKLTPLAIRSVWNFNPDVNLILGSVLPADENVDFAALDFFVSQHETQAELQAWQRIVLLAREKPIALQKAFPLLDELITQNRTAEVQRAWREALEASRWTAAPPVDHSVVWNGGFEAPIANGGLDWRIQQVPGAYISVDSVVHHSGSRSLRVGFTGGVNLDFAHVQQIEPVQPNAVYDFQAYVRTEDISTDSGVHFEIFDPERQSQVYVLTPNMRGSTPWISVHAKVTTSPQTHFLEVRLHRFPSHFFDNKISGTIWVDDVTLTPRPASAKHPQL